MAFDKIKYDAAWRKEHKYRFTVEIPKDKEEVLKKIARDRKRPMSEIVIEAIEAYYQIDLTN